MQNINLYVAELRPEKKFLTATSLAVSMLCCLVLMVLISVLASMDLKRYEQSVLALESSKTAEKENVDRIKEQSPKFAAEKIDQEIDHLRARVSHLTRVSELIGSQSLGNEAGYSQRMKDLAVASDANISLSAFRFSAGEKKVELHGLTRSPARITEYVKSVKDADSFDKAKFGPLTIRYSENNANEHMFSFGYEGIFDSSAQLVDASQ